VLKKLTIMYPKEYEEDLILLIGKLGCVEFIVPEEVMGFRREVPEETRYVILLIDKMEKLAGKFGIDLKKYVSDVSREVEIRRYRYEELLGEYNNLEKSLSEIAALATLTKELENLRIFECILRASPKAESIYREGGKAIMVDRLNEDYIKAMLDNIGVEYIVASYGDNTIFYMSVKNDEIWNIIRLIISKIDYRVIDIPKLETDKTSIIEAVRNRILELESTTKRIKNQRDRIIKDATIKLARLYRKALILNKFLKARTYSLKGEYIAFLQCWVPEDKIIHLEEAIKKLKGITVSILKEKPGRREETPTPIKPGKVVPSWQSLFLQMGYPTREDIFPWFLAGIMWAFMFGFMFPDIGQGLAIILMGIIFYRKREVFGFSGKKLGNLFITVGLSSTFFGLLYGEFFLVEIYPPLMPGLVEHWLEDRASVSWVIKYALLIGIIEIVLACFLFMYRSIKHGEYKEAIFGEWGIPGLAMYLGLILTGLYFIGITLLRPFEIAGIKVSLVFPRKGMAVFNPLALVDSWPFYVLLAGIVLFLVGGIIEKNLGDKLPSLIEMLLSMIANTLSFTRLAGFLIGHAAFALVVEVMKNMGTVVYYGMLLGMNFLVLTLELLVVSLQALRLLFYEFSTKWYIGRGRAFRPFRL